jgi:uncharacterized membrane protein YesL
MAGIFGFFDYSKPGKGVSPDEPQKPPFFRFWSLLWRKLGKFILINLVYFAATLPILTLIYLNFYAMLLDPAAVPATAEETVLSVLPGMLMSAAMRLPPALSGVLLALSVALYGPLTCGMTYILRNYYREEHAWLTDLFERAKQNLRQGLLLGILDFAVVSLLLMNLFLQESPQLPAGLLTVVRYASGLFLVFYLLARQYTYLLAVTFELSLRNILKNSFIFAIVGLWRNLLSAVLCVATVVAVTLLHQAAELVLLPLLLYTFTGFIGMFCCYPVVKKHMLAEKTEDPLDEPPEDLV